MDVQMSLVGPLNPSVIGTLSAESAVARFRDLLRCEAQYAGLRPDAVTISSNLYMPDGGIDAQVESDHPLPQDTFLKLGRNGFQLKTGTSFIPWRQSSLREELLTTSGDLVSEVRRTLESSGQYILVCFGLDFTPEQRNSSKFLISQLFAGFGYTDMEERIVVLGQCQIASYFERYPSLRLSLIGGSDEDFLSISEWSQHAHMSNRVILSDEQIERIDSIREKLRGETKHIRILGEPGIGKTRLVLEAVSSEDLASSVLYVQHGSKFSSTDLFRELLRDHPDYPIILVLDELSERDMSEIWAHLKDRCGSLKIISLDHGRDRSLDAEIERIRAPRLPDQTIKLILERHIGEHHNLDRWVSLCEGSPRVAQAVGENLAANPADILKPPATVPIWDRFLFGYAHQHSDDARQVALVMRHIALFSRFGFEDPVGNEARYIAETVTASDPAISWPRFQEIIQSLRERRILQGDRTLFIVPWALHIHLWREYWHWYGRVFDFVTAFESMPESLHSWFMDMFRYAHGTDASRVVREILRPDGIYANRRFLCSEKGTLFLSELAEADPEATIELIERTFGNWSYDELYAFKNNRQRVVWTLEKIAVWQPTFIRATKILARLAVAENAEYSNNSTGTLLSLFGIGPEWAATEASPSERLPVMIEMLRSDDDKLKHIGLKIAEAALGTWGGTRIIGPENQGLKERASLWKPATYGDWWNALRLFWDHLIKETRGWSDSLRTQANSTILTAASGLLRIEALVESILETIESITIDPLTDTKKLNHFFIENAHNWRTKEYGADVRIKLRRIEARVVRLDLKTRFQRYVLDTSWFEWKDFDEAGKLRENSRPKRLVQALATRVADNDEAFMLLLPVIADGNTDTPALIIFGESLCVADQGYRRLTPLLEYSRDTKNFQCLGGYIHELQGRDPSKWKDILLDLLSEEDTAFVGAELFSRSRLNDQVLNACLDAFEAKWIGPSCFYHICFGKNWNDISVESLVRLAKLLAADESNRTSSNILVDLLDQCLQGQDWPVETEFVFDVVTTAAHFDDNRDTMHAYHWRNVCEKMVAYDQAKAAPLLDAILHQMRENYRLSYDNDVGALAHSISRLNPTEAWKIISSHLLSESPKWRSDVFEWLKGGIGGFDDKTSKPPITVFSVQDILEWIEEDTEFRAPMIAHCVPRSLDDEHGGALTREILTRYQSLDGVVSGISCIFHSGGWSGPRSLHFRARRDRFLNWLSKGFDRNVVSWLEAEIRELDREIEAAEISEEREPWNRPER